MNLGFYIDSQAQSETTNKIYNMLNNLVENNKVDNATLFYNDIDFNPVIPKFGCFNSTDVWYFTGNLVVTTIKNALSLGKIINKFKPVFLYNGEKNSALELIAITKSMPIVAQNKEEAQYIKRVTGVEPKLIPEEKIENVLEILND
tara:strand:+ start:89 stop:526 length:438 start_codon:yes stop_codon:yes gene_type:complete